MIIADNIDTDAKNDVFVILINESRNIEREMAFQIVRSGVT